MGPTLRGPTPRQVFHPQGLNPLKSLARLPKPLASAEPETMKLKKTKKENIETERMKFPR
jgi:hypothetical protein